MPGEFRTHLTYANVVATIALFLALGGTAVAAVMITSNSQVGPNTISGHKAPAGAHANILSGSINGTDLSSDIKGALTAHCAAGLQRAADLCFEPTLRTAIDYGTALAMCAASGRRLPTVAELVEVFNHSGAPQSKQWSESFFIDGSNPAGTQVYEDSARVVYFTSNTYSVATPYRCVVTPIG